MQRKISKKSLYNAGKNKTEEAVIHLHMSNHYRRILNAKKAIDCSPPYSYKLRKGSTEGQKLNKNRQPNEQVECLPLTDRSLSTNSNKDSCWGAESGTSSSRYHTRCIPPLAEPRHASPSTVHNQKMELVDRITYDTKNGPAAYCDEAWLEVKAQHNDKHYRLMNEAKIPAKKSKRQLLSNPTTEGPQNRKAGPQAVQKKLKSGAKVHKPFPPVASNALKTQPVSKLRSLRVYHPPRRKVTRTKPETPSNSAHPLGSSSTCISHETVLKKTSFNPKEQSVTSSRDSAYNGGVSSVPESRSPTPDQRKKKDCCCCCCEKKQEEKAFEPSKPPTGRVETPRSPKPPLPSKTPPTPKPRTNFQEDSYKKMQEDALYVKFIQDITTEILEKNLYTNKALKKVMKKHIQNNVNKLQKERMLREVENLRIQLGIPEDKALLEVEAEGDRCSLESPKYPVISDSEFVMPKMAAKKMQTSISGVIASLRKREKVVSETETDGAEEISVVQVAKAIRDRRMAEVSAARRNSSDDSYRPSDPKKRSLFKSRKHKMARVYSTSSSDSSELSRAVAGRPECEAAVPREAYCPGNFVQRCSYLSKKNRSVSFWKNPDLNLSRAYESRLKNTVFRGLNSPPRENQNND